MVAWSRGTSNLLGHLTENCPHVRHLGAVLRRGAFPRPPAQRLDLQVAARVHLAGEDDPGGAVLAGDLGGAHPAQLVRAAQDPYSADPAATAAAPDDQQTLP